MHAKTLAALLLLAGLAGAQTSKNCKLLSQWRPANGAANDCWGYYHEATDTEYVLLCTTAGTYVLNAKDPTKPRVTGYIPASASGWRNSPWRDIKVFGSYAYGVTESGGGMQIIDLRDPEKPKYVGTYKPSSVSWTNTHNIAMDEQNGIAYCCGTRSGMHIIDVKTNPTSPRYIANFRSPYIHDLHIEHGLAHCADIWGNNYFILDVSKLPTIKRLGSARAPGIRYCHNNWATYDKLFSVATNESAGGPVSIWDISNLNAPRNIANYRANPTTARQAIPHNAFILDRVMHVSHYTEGYRTVDLSVPSKPVELGYYDTWSGASTGYNGNWGVYPFTRSGNMFLSDRSTGLYIVKPLASARRYGKGTVGTGGKLPHIHHFGAAYLGNANYKLGVRNARARTAAVLVLGGKAANLNIGGLNVLVDLSSPVPAITASATDANGAAMFGLPIPASTNLRGLRLNAQWFCLDAGGKLGLSASEGLEFEIFAR